jgi:hypothetical protein
VETILGLGTVGDPRLRLLFHYWQARQAGRAMPSPDVIDLTELPQAVKPNAMLLDVAIENGRRRFLYRSVGGVFWRTAGKEPVGRYVDEVLPETAGYRDYVVGIYDEMAARQRPMYTENLFILSHGQRDPMTTKRVSLPLSRDGAMVHAVLAAHVFDYGASGDDAFALVTAIEEGVRSFLA